MHTKNHYQMSVQNVLKDLNSSITGLTEKQVEERKLDAQKYQILPEKHQSFFTKFLLQLKDIMVLILLISGVVSLLIGLIQNSATEIADGLIILGIVIMNALFGVFQERKSEKAIDSLKNLTKPQAEVLRENKLSKINASDLVLGDVVYLDAGCIVPADSRLIDGTSLRLNESSLTGEGEAKNKAADVVYDKDVALGDRKNMVYAGSIVENGRGYGVVVKIGNQTEIGKIAQSLKDSKKDLTPLQKSLQGVGKILTWLILLMAGTTFILEVLTNPNQILNSFLTAIAISVAAIPESMPAAITIIMSLGISKLSKQKAIVKRMHAIETLGACDVICSDKTGTITQNKMKIKEVFNFFEEKSKKFNLFLDCMVLCNDAQNAKTGYMGSSTEVALLNFAKQKRYQVEKSREENVRLDEISFNSKNKTMTTLNYLNGEKICFLKGALDRVLEKCSYYQTDTETISLDQKAKETILLQNKKMCEKAERVLCFAYKKSNTIKNENFTFLGLCGIQDPPRKEVESAVKNFKKAGIKTIMITGDYKETALSIAKSVGIATNDGQAISGDEIDKLSEEEFLKVVETKTIFARVSPMHKSRIVATLKQNGHIVAMTGDGINDAPSLKKADIGVGMGRSGTDVTKEVADMIITDDNFATIYVAVKEGRKIYSNIQKTIKYLFSANMAEILSLFFITLLLPGKIFLLPAQILFINLITDSLPAIALGTESAEKNLMLEKPRNKSSNLFSNGMGTELLILGGVQTILTIGAYLIGLYLEGESAASTMAFYTLNLLQLFYMFTARTKESCFRSNPFKNKFFSLSLLVGFGLLFAMATTPLGDILKLSQLTSFCWAIVLIFSLSIVFIGELYKVIFRQIKKRKLH